jgi:radical SAM superfamily enzyme YgiQ (UPF0313 family)
MSFARNDELMRLARESGCRGLFFGLETVSETSMKRMKKSFSGLAEVEEGIRAIQSHGIKFHASVVFGFDTDGPEIFEETVDFLIRTRTHSVTFNILTPYPGTAVYDRLKAEGRLFTEDWFYYDHTTVVFRPQTMTAQALAEGQLQARRSFYSFKNILRRSTRHLRNPLFYSAINLAMRFAARRASLPLAPPANPPEPAGTGGPAAPAEKPPSPCPEGSGPSAGAAS